MAVTQSQYNFIKFAATGDRLSFKGILAGFIMTKNSRTTVGAVRIQSYGKHMEIVPLHYYLSAAVPVSVINLPEFGIPLQAMGSSPAGLHLTVCSNMTVIAIRR